MWLVHLEAITNCRGCKRPFVSENVLLDLGEQAVIKFKGSPEEPDDFAPLRVIMCDQCHLVQLAHTVPQDRLFRDYHYLSGVNSSMKEALRETVEHCEHLVELKPDDYVMDIGSNDGTLLRCYRRYVNVIGFEPALNIPAPRNVFTIKDYFSLKEASQYPKPKIITACAMFYDLDDPNQFCADIKQVLHPEGIMLIQMNYLGDMIDRLTLDNISHEHLCYYSAAALDSILERNGLMITGITFNDVNSGSMRTIITHKQKGGKIPNVRWPEKTNRLIAQSTYVDFADRIRHEKEKIIEYVTSEKSKRHNIWGYGASTRGNTLLQWLGFDSKIIDKIADRNPRKWGKFTAGGNIPITSEQEMRDTQPDNLLVLPYHFAQEFLEREEDYIRHGGKMLFPLPNFRVHPNTIESP